MTAVADWIRAHIGPLSARVALPEDDGVMMRHELREVATPPPNVTPMRYAPSRRGSRSYAEDGPLTIEEKHK